MATDILAAFLLFFIIFLIIGVPAAAIANDKSNRTMGRKSFVFWNLGTILIFILNILLISAIYAMKDSWSGPMFIVYIIFILLIFSLGILEIVLLFWILPQRVLQRVRDTGWSPALSYIYTVPMAHLIFAVVLLFVPSATSSIKTPLPAGPS